MDEQWREAGEVGAALVSDLGEYFGVAADMAQIERRAYKDTSCGAWIKIDERGLVIGSIVEGSDAEVPPQILSMSEYLGMEGAEFKAWMDRAIEEVEIEADLMWQEANN